MWECAINLTSDNTNCAQKMYKSLKDKASSFGSIVSCYEESGYITLLVASEDYDKARMNYVVSDAIITAICCDFKQQYLEKNLKIIVADKLIYVALLSSLVFFDRETDVHILKRSLRLNGSIFLESYFDFRLNQLKQKWWELAKLASDNIGEIANENSAIELINFLIENLECNYQTVSVVAEQDRYLICEDTNSYVDKEKLIQKLIEDNPKSINLYSDENNDITVFLKKIFQQKIKIFPLCEKPKSI